MSSKCVGKYSIRKIESPTRVELEDGVVPLLSWNPAIDGPHEDGKADSKVTRGKSEESNIEQQYAC